MSGAHRQDPGEPMPPAVEDGERMTDPDADDSLPDHLAGDPEIPVPDVIDQQRLVVLDDER